jgi:DNA repair exonuclease SbcCD nuclease subunit
VSRFRFVHAADLHLDTPFEGVGRTDPAVREALRDASLDAWDDLVSLTIDRQAEFLLLAGDIYDGSERGVRAQLRFRRGLERLAEHGIQAFVVHGNHDPVAGWSAVQTWPATVKIFGSAMVESFAVERDGRRLATVHGISYARPDTTENLVLRFARGSEPGFHVGLLHCNVGGNAEHAPYSPCTLDELRRAGMDYWALGHIHKRQVLHEHPFIVYPGNLQGRGTKTSEAGAKGATVVDVADGQIAAIEFAPVDRIRFVRCSVDISRCKDVAQLQKAIEREGATLRAAHAERGLLVSVALTGRDGPRGDLKRPGVIDDLLRDLRHQADGLEPFLWWHDLSDRTRLALDRPVIRSRGDFGAEIVRGVEALAADAERRAAFIARALHGLRDRATLRYLGEVTPDDEAELLADAEGLALDLLDDEEPA